MKQSSLDLNLSTKKTRKQQLLDEMELVVPWAALVELIAPYYPEGKNGRPPFALQTMLRIHCMQQWFSLSDLGMEEAFFDTPIYREFAQLDAHGRMPDESTILRFRHRLERHKLADQILATVNELLAAQGLLLKAGTAVDATLIAAPSSTKNKDKKRDPEMHSSQKGNEWHFGMKAHIGVDADSGLVHTVRGTSGNVSDVVEGNSLLHGQETDTVLFAGCASQGKPPPSISLDEPVQAQPLPEPPKPVEVVTVPQPLALPSQLKPLPEAEETKPAPEPADEKVRVSRANAEARVAPTREGYVNAIQVWPFTDGALYQVYAAVGRVTVVSLQPGEELVTVAAGDTVRWIVGDTSSGSGDALRVNVMVKPIRSGLKTNLVITTSRRTYLLELTSTEKTWMASVSWEYPKDRMLALQRQAQAASAAAPVDAGLLLEKIRFRYAVSGSNPPWKPLRAFDDGEKVYIQFPPGIAQGELPPLFVIGAQGDGQLVNYRFRSPYYIVDRLFGAAELRLGGDKDDVVRIERTDGVSGGTRRN